MGSNLRSALLFLLDFIKNPFAKPINRFETNNSLIALTAFIVGLVYIIEITIKIIIDPSLILLLIGAICVFIVAPIVAYFTVYIKGYILNVYLKHIISPLLKVKYDNLLQAKQIESFTTIGLIIGTIPYLSYLGIIVGLIIQVFGLIRLFKMETKSAIIFGVGYYVIWNIVVLLLTQIAK